MKKLIESIKKVFEIEDLRTRILNTLFFIGIYRLGSYVVLPGIDPTRLDSGQTGVLGILDTLLGGTGVNKLLGGGGDDTITITAGTNTVFGGDGGRAEECGDHKHRGNAKHSSAHQRESWS